MMKPARKRRLGFILVIIGGLAVTIGLALFAMKNSINLFYAPSAIAAGKAPTGALIRIGGLVVKGSYHRDPKSLKAEFVLTDNAEQVDVSYEGILPDLFREGQGIVAMGRLQKNGKFVATQVLAKHDETYMSPEVADAIKKAEAKARARTKTSTGGVASASGGRRS